VEDLLKEVGPAFYQRTDLRLSHPVSKQAMSHILVEEAPAEIGGEKVSGISTIDGVKYLIADESWLLIRPSGTEPVLRVYAEGHTPEMVQALLGYGEKVATQVA
jgi:phosphomannomutase